VLALVTAVEAVLAVSTTATSTWCCCCSCTTGFICSQYSVVRGAAPSRFEGCMCAAHDFPLVESSNQHQHILFGMAHMVVLAK
jgi:hypothetical protein